MPYVIPELPAGASPGAPPRRRPGRKWDMPWRGVTARSALDHCGRGGIAEVAIGSSSACSAMIALSIVGATWRVLAG